MTSVEPLESRRLLAALPAGFVETTLATGISAPTSMAVAPDGRVFIAEQTGALRVIKNGQLLPTPFVTLKVDSRGERGLLGVAVHPQFEASGRAVYVYYTVPGRKGIPVHNRVSLFRDAGDVAQRYSERILLELDPLSSATNHNGGALAFAPDQSLFIATGDNDNAALAPDVRSRLGKILRVSSNGSIPSDNPFVAKKGAAQEVWALGLRNPFNFAFNPVSGAMFINDVGEHTFEEINDGIAGANYGWPATEGPTSRARFRSPIFSYVHGDGPTTGNAIVGAAFYTPKNGRTFPKNYAGDYFFADLTSGWIRRLDPATKEAAFFAQGIQVPVAIAVADDGALLYLSRGFGQSTGELKRVQFGVSAQLARPSTPAPPSNPFSTRPIAPDDDHAIWE